MSKKVEKILRNLPDCKPVAQAIIIERLQNQLKDAEEVIRFYSNSNSYSYSQVIDDESDVNGSLSAGKKAREYFKKYGGNDE